MECDSIQTIIPNYLKNVASEENMRQVEEHLCICQICRDFLSQRIENPEYSTRKHIENIIAEKSKLSRLDYIVIAVGLAVVALFVVLFFIK